MMGGWRSGRERKVRTYLSDDWAACAAPGRAGGLLSRGRLAGSQPRAIVSAIHATPAPAASRNLRRVISTLKPLTFSFPCPPRYLKVWCKTVTLFRSRPVSKLETPGTLFSTTLNPLSARRFYFYSRISENTPLQALGCTS